jgi:hypothetical protein
MEIEKFVTERLQDGFASGNPPYGIHKDGFNMQAARLLDHEAGLAYHDEWTNGRLGGGQELAKLTDEEQEETLTRLYAGGVIAPEELEALGVTRKEVIGYLKKQIIENGDKTRLYEDFEPEADGDWQYRYRILDYDHQIDLYISKETIFYKGVFVFAHGFLISPVK